MVDGGSALGTSMFFAEAEGQEMFLQCGSVHMFGEYVGHVVLAGNLHQLEFFTSELLLNPEVCRGEVAYFAKPPPPADPYCSRRVSEHSEVPVEAKIISDSDESQAR